MAEEGPGARRLSPHNKDPSLVTSYLPPNLQKAPCHPSKAPAPAACAATRRDGGVAADPLLCPPACPPSAPRPSRSADAQRGAAAAAPSPRGPVSLLPAEGGMREPPGAPFPSRPLLSIPPPRFILLVAPGGAPSLFPGSSRGRSPPAPRPAAGSPLPAPRPTGRAPRVTRRRCGAGGVPLTIERATGTEI